MKRIYLIIIGLIFVIYSYGQNPVQVVLAQIEENNPRLEAAAAEVEAQKLANRSEALPGNPEVEFNYLRGGGGLRHDVRVAQAFDIPTLTGMRSRQVSGLDDLAGLSYRTERQEVLLEAKQACIDLVYCNSLLGELGTHLSQARMLVSSFEKRIKAGDATVLDLNKAKVHLTSVQGQVAIARVERQSLLSKLRALNGGKEVVFDESGYDAAETLPGDFETWYAEASRLSPVLEYARQEVEAGRKQLAIDKTSWLPEFTVGYMGEITKEESFRGVTLGLNIPLWSNANKVRQARAAVTAAQSRKVAAEKQFYHQLQDQYSRAAALKENSELMRSSLADTDNRDFLIAAQSKGEISIIDYLVETDLYYEALEQTLAAERDYRHALAELNATGL